MSLVKRLLSNAGLLKTDFEVVVVDGVVGIVVVVVVEVTVLLTISGALVEPLVVLLVELLLVGVRLRVVECRIVETVND